MTFPDSDPLIQFDYTLRSRYGETDKMGYVYHGHYLQYFEVARTEMIRSYGLSYRQMEEEGYMLPVIHAELEYKSPVFYDEQILIRVLIFKEPGVRLQTYYQIIARERDEICVLGEVTLCFMDANTRKLRRAPQYFLTKMRQENKS